MTPAEYMDRAKFPVTSDPDYSIADQLMMDAFNYDQLKEHVVDRGVPLTDEQKQIWAELRVKIPAQSEVRKALKDGN